MDKQSLYDSFCGLDEKYLSEYESEIKTYKKKRTAVITAVVCAVCAVIALPVGAYISDNGFIRNSPALPDESSAPVSVESNLAVADGVTRENTETQKIEYEQTENGNYKNEQTENVTSFSEKETEQLPQKGGDTSEFIRKNTLGPDGTSYYEVFFPEQDVFSPLDEMTLANRFCSFTFNRMSYYPASEEEISPDEYETEPIGDSIASHWELRSANVEDEVAGIVYRARVDVYKLKNCAPDEAVAAVISFNGEKKAYRYNAQAIPNP